jgi:3-hydroxyisobutyrate dehydrogenase-like beta-hydroxyacid dehydrogenase
VAPLTVALLGLGEAGSALAGDLVAAGASVRGFDPVSGTDIAGVQRAADVRAAVDGSDVVLSVTAASAALEAALDAAFAGHLGPLGMPVEVLGEEPGAAATRKLLRSVFMKGLAASCLESLRAARAAGCEDWMRAEIEAVLAGADAALLERLVTGSARHATRRVGEVADARELLDELGVEPRVTVAAGGWLAELEDEGRGSV